MSCWCGIMFPSNINIFYHCQSIELFDLSSKLDNQDFNHIRRPLLFKLDFGSGAWIKRVRHRVNKRMDGTKQNRPAHIGKVLRKGGKHVPERLPPPKFCHLYDQNPLANCGLLLHRTHPPTLTSHTQQPFTRSQESCSPAQP